MSSKALRDIKVGQKVLHNNEEIIVLHHGAQGRTEVHYVEIDAPRSLYSTNTVSEQRDEPPFTPFDPPFSEVALTQVKRAHLFIGFLSGLATAMTVVSWVWWMS